MTVPSYEDLTPGIPDEVDAKSASQLALFLRHDLPRPAAAPKPVAPPATPDRQRSCATPSLFACLRTSDQARPSGEFHGVLAIARDFSPRVRRVSHHEVLLDVSGLGRLVGEPPAIRAALAKALADAGIEAGVATAPAQTVARLLATQAPGYPLDRFSDLPVALLVPLETLPPGLSERDRARPYETLERWGIVTLGDLADLPAGELSSRLGRRGVALQRLAYGLDPQPFVPDGETPRYIGRLELEWPIDALEPLSFVFARLLEPLSAALERADRGAVALHMDLRLTTRDTCSRLLQLPAPMRDPRVLRTLLLLDLESHPPFGAREGREVQIDIVSIEIDPAPARITQFSLLQRALPSPETLSTLSARLSALVGESRVGSAALLDSHRPDAFELRRYEPEGRGGKGGGGAGGAEGAGGALACVLRRQRVPPAIRVSVEHGRPVHIAAARRSMPAGAIVQAAGPWRTTGGWWHEPVGTEGGRPEHGTAEGGWNRDEWDVAIADGAVCRIFQDRTTGRWFLEGVYD